MNILRQDLPITDKIIQYTNLIHTHGLWSPDAEAFKRSHANDKDFQHQAKKLEEFFLNRDRKAGRDLLAVVAFYCFVVIMILTLIALATLKLQA